MQFEDSNFPTEEEAADWTLDLGGGIKLPFANATYNTSMPEAWTFNHDPLWTAGDQVAVSIRTDELQNRIGQVKFKSRRNTSVSGGNIVYGKTHFIYDRSNGGKFGPRDRWELQRLNVTTDKTGDTDPVWIAATFRAPDAYTGYQGWWEGQFDDFHTLFLRWIYHEGGIGKGEATYTFPLKAAAEEGGIRRSSSGRDITFTWVRTYKEFQRRHLDLANHSDFVADMLAPPKPATARAGGEGGDEFSLSGYYEPVTVTSMDFTSNPGSDQVYGPWSTIQVTVTFSEDVTVGYVGSKRDAAELDLEMDGQTRTAHYARTEGNRVKFEYTVLAGDEETFALRLRPNSLRLSRDKPSEHGSIRDSEGRDAVLDHYGLASTAHRVDAVSPEFASAQVSTDGAQVAVTFDESIKSPAILRWFGVQTSLLQSLTLDVWVDGELAVRSDAALSGDTVTLTMAEPITQGQTVTVSYDNLFVQTGESIFEDLHGNNLLAFTERPVTNGSTVADVERPDGGLALSRTDLEIDEGESGTYTVALASQPASDVTVEISQRPPGRATVSPASLTFTADNWNTPQTVTITSAEDANYVDRWLLLRHVATGDNYSASAAALLLLRDGYNLKTATPNTGATGRPTISGTPQVGQTLTLDTSEIADADGLTHASYTWLYQWLRGDSEIRGATDSTYTLGLADAGKAIKVKVSFTDDANNAESRTSAATVAVAPRPNSRPTGAPTINGTPQVRQTLTVDTSEIADADGLETAVFRYQWFAAIGLATLEFHGETSSTYTLGPLSEGLAIKVKVSFTDDRGHSETLTSAATETVIAADPNSEPTGLPAINGTPQVGETLTADTSAIDDPDGLTNVAYRYQWIAGGSDIDGATGASYTLTASEQGQTVRVRVTFTDDAGNAESLTSAATVAVAPKPNAEPTGLPAITGPPQVGQTLTADTSPIDDEDGLTNATFEYQWIAGGSDIDGATGSSYTLTASEQGQTIQVRVTFTDDADDEETLTSEATAEVTVAPAPLTGAFHDLPDSHDGSTAFTFRVLFSEDVGINYVNMRDDAFSLSEGDVTGARRVDGRNDLWEITVEPDDNSDVGITLPANRSCTTTGAICTREDSPRQLTNSPTATVTGPAEAPPTNTSAAGAPTISGTPQVEQTLTADTSSITDADGLTNVSYAYQWIAGGSDIDGATGSSYTLTASEQGQTIQVRVTFTDDADNEETLTSEATAEVTVAPAPLTGAFHDLPDSHDGSTAFTFRVLFSEDVGISYVDMRDDAFSLSEGDVTGARRVDGRNDLWEITVEPDDNSDVGITLPANRSCTTTGAICTREDSPRQLTNSPTATITGPAEAPPTNTSAAGAPTISGTPQVEQTLTADTSSITDEDGLTNVSYSYQWIAGGSDIDGATGSTYTLTSSEQGQTVQVRVTFTDDADNQETLTSVATVAVTAAPNREATGQPTIGGTPQVEETLTADTANIADQDGLTSVSYSYQWIAGGSDIDGATGSTYTLTSSEEGQTIQVRVTFTDDADNEETLTSAATVAVASSPVPLTASRPDSRFQSARHNGADDRPQVIVAFSLPVASFEKTTPSVSLTGAAVSSVRRHQEDGLENAWIFFLDPDGSDDIVLSLVTGRPCDSGGICTEGGTALSEGVQVTLPGPEEEGGDDQQTPQSPPAKPTNLTATVNADGHIVLSWTAPNDDSITGYQILRRRPSEGESALLVYVADTESTATTFTDTGVTAGVTHVYRVKAINAAGLSGWSNYVNPTP